MRRFLRILFGAITVLSLLCCLALATLWARSYSGTDLISRGRITAADYYAITSEDEVLSVTRGQVRFALRQHTGYHRGHTDLSKLPGPEVTHWSRARLGKNHINWEAPTATRWNRLGFGQWESGWGSSFADSHDRNWGAPIWPAVVLFAVLPTIWLVRTMRRRRAYAAGRCARCGYDLRATPERCPECGTTAPAARVTTFGPS